MRDKVEQGSNVYTDQYRPYSAFSNHFNYGLVNHSAGQYVSGTFYTNNIENFWSLFKRGLDGIYHHVTDNHLERYVNEFTFIYNNRDISEGFNFDVAIANGVNKSLKYKTLIED